MRETGMTLLEILIVLGIASVLIIGATPSMNRMSDARNVIVQVDSLYTAAQLARMRAVSDKREVVICASSDQNACGTAWDQGWIVFVDDNSNKLRESTEELLLVHVPQRSFLLKRTSLENAIVFHPSGQIDETTSFFACSRHLDSTANRGLSVFLTGTVDFSADDDGDGVHEDINGDPITCL